MQRSTVGPSSSAVEALRDAVQRRISSHQSRLYKDPEEGRDAVNVLRQVEELRRHHSAARGGRVAPIARRPRATGGSSAAAVENAVRGVTPVPSATATTTRTVSPGEMPAAVVALSQPQAAEDASAASAVTQEELDLLQAENDAMELFLLRHPTPPPPNPDHNHHEDHLGDVSPVTTSALSCGEFMRALQRELDEAVIRIGEMMMSPQQHLTFEAAGQPVRSVSLRAQLCQKVANLKSENDALLNECSILEAEVDRYASAVPTSRGVPWSIAQDMFPRIPTSRSATPLVTAAGWFRFAAESRRRRDEATFQLAQLAPIKENNRNVEDALKGQLEMILRHLTSATDVRTQRV